MDKAILKCNEGLIQLRQCPKCLYMVMEVDVSWKKKPFDLNDPGEIEMCKFCKGNEKK